MSYQPLLALDLIFFLQDTTTPHQFIRPTTQRLKIPVSRDQRCAFRCRVTSLLHGSSTVICERLQPNAQVQNNYLFSSIFTAQREHTAISEHVLCDYVCLICQCSVESGNG